MNPVVSIFQGYYYLIGIAFSFAKTFALACKFKVTCALQMRDVLAKTLATRIFFFLNFLWEIHLGEILPRKKCAAHNSSQEARI